MHNVFTVGANFSLPSPRHSAVGQAGHNVFTVGVNFSLPYSTIVRPVMQSSHIGQSPYLLFNLACVATALTSLSAAANARLAVSLRLRPEIEFFVLSSLNASFISELSHFKLFNWIHNSHGYTRTTKRRQYYIEINQDNKLFAKCKNCDYKIQQNVARMRRHHEK